MGIIESRSDMERRRVRGIQSDVRAVRGAASVGLVGLGHSEGRYIVDQNKLENDTCYASGSSEPYWSRRHQIVRNAATPAAKRIIRRIGIGAGVVAIAVPMILSPLIYQVVTKTSEVVNTTHAVVEVLSTDEQLERERMIVNHMRDEFDKTLADPQALESAVARAKKRLSE